MTFSIKENHFYLNGKKNFLLSGEIHYFRIKRELWDTHLDAARDAGLTTVSTYVPWDWHEPEESFFDFEGLSCPERDLKGWIEKCQAHGLTCILKPGPFILAEWRGAGLPDWFLDRYRDEIKMRDSQGNMVKSDGVSLFNPVFLEKVALWYDRVMPIISEQEISAGGPVIMMQVCNEIGVFSWLAHQADYGNAVRERFIVYLTRKFSNIEEVNRLWGTGYFGFEQVQLPPDGALTYASRGDRGRDYEWHCFWRAYYGQYLRLLVRMARERGVKVPFYHNLPGWIYGNGYEFPVNITMYEDLYGDREGILFGVDHIPEFQSYRNLHDDRIINDIAHAMQGNKPLFAAEFQCGSREYHVVTNPREMELFYKASIANGLTGWNYYMFSQGRNPERKGYSGGTFYWFNPLTPEGARTHAYPLVKRMNQIIKISENIILEAERKAEVAVLFYPPYYATELERPVDGAVDLQFIASSIRRPAYFDGLLKALQVLNIDYDMVDPGKTSAGAMARYKQIWVFATDEMNGSDQQLLVDYARAGGQCVIFPYLPDRDLSQQPCTILRDALSIAPSGTETTDSPLVDIFDLKDIKCANPQVVYSDESLENCEIIARTIRGTACGFIKKLGNGSVIHLGTWIGFDTEGHKPVYEAILNKSGARLRQASSGNEYLIVRERFTDNAAAVLFIGNYYNEEQTGTVSYTHPIGGETVSLPYFGNEISWPPLYGLLTPVCHEIDDKIKILHSTSDILDIQKQKGKLLLTLYGDRDLPGEMVLEGDHVYRIQSVTCDGDKLPIIHDAKRMVVSYKHFHKKEMVMAIEVD